MAHRGCRFLLVLLFNVNLFALPGDASAGQKKSNPKQSRAEITVEHSTDTQTVPASPNASLNARADTVVGYPLSDRFRRAVVTIPDQIEALRAAMRERSAINGVRFDEIDAQLEESRRFVESPADLNVYYALFHANHLLAMSFYRRLAKAPEDEIAQGQLESVTCSLESKFALLRGVLYSGIQNCSILAQVSEGVVSDSTQSPSIPSAAVSYPLQPLVNFGLSAAPNSFVALSCEYSKVGPRTNSSDQGSNSLAAGSENHPAGIKGSLGTVVRHTFEILGGGRSSDQTSH